MSNHGQQQHGSCNTSHDNGIFKNDSDEPDATELGRLNVLPAPASTQGLENPVDETATQSRMEWRSNVRKYWKNYIQLHVPHAACRDHLANERTFLSYQRTSLALSMLGVVTAQLFSLQHSPNPNPTFGYHRLGPILATLFQATAIIVVLIGGHRFWRQQMNMARGMVWAGGWEIWTIMVGMLILLLLVFGLLLAADINAI